MIVETREQFDEMLTLVAESKSVVTDTETTGLHPFQGDHICGVGVGTDLEHLWYLPFRHTGELYEGGNLPEEWLNELAIALSKVPTLIGFNIKFDLLMLQLEGYEPDEEQQLIDGLIMARMCVPEKHPPGGLNLENMMNRFLGEGEGAYNKDLKEWMHKNKMWIESRGVRHYDHVPIDRLGPYCIKDIEGTLRLAHVFQQLIVDTEQLGVWKKEIKATRVFYDMELVGMQADVDYCDAAIEKIEVRQEEIKAELLELVGTEFNINSSQQITRALNNIGIYSPLKTPSGAQSWGKETLALMGDAAHPSIKLIREFKSWGTLKGTYLEVFRDAGTVHCIFKPWGAITGRISCSNPNMQNVPRSARAMVDDTDVAEAHQSILTELLGEGAAQQFTLVDMTYEAGDYEEADDRMVAARRALIPREGYELVAIDYSQMEMLVFLCYVNNKRLLKRVVDSYERGEPFDFHNIVAEEVWGPRLLEDGTENPDFKLYRRWAKAINFGLIFGIGDKKLGVQLGVSTEEARAYKNQYFDRIEGSREFINRVVTTLESRGYVNNYFGRRYTIEPGREYVGVNYLVQGSCADFMKDRMWLVRKAIQGTGARILLQVHDELVLEVPKALVASVAQTVKEVMEEKVFAIRLPVEASRCPASWIEKLPIESI